MDINKSLKARNDKLAAPAAQLAVLNQSAVSGKNFGDAIFDAGQFPFQPYALDILYVNIGKTCNQVCNHCHVDAGPDRQEQMTRETMQHCIRAAAVSNVHTIDITGGAPELHPDFRWFVEQLALIGKKIIVRSNLTVLVTGNAGNDLPAFFKKHKVEIAASLPGFTATVTDAQRGEGTFDKSIRALQLLNDAGYGKPDSGLVLNLVHNPSGIQLPGGQKITELDFKKNLEEQFGIVFNNLFVITNSPVGRFLEYLLRSGNFEIYIRKLADAFNPDAAAYTMCRNSISIGWDGQLYDCDFNQMLELQLTDPQIRHVAEFNADALTGRTITINQHCFGCTAGEGSGFCGATAQTT